MFAELFQLFIKAEFDQELCPWRICQSLTFPRPLVPLPTLLRIPAARCLAMLDNSPSQVLAVSAIYTADRTSASQRPVFGNQPTKLWLWYRRESKLSISQLRPERKWHGIVSDWRAPRDWYPIGGNQCWVCVTPSLVLTPAVPASF